jgi:dihydroorotase-like cyclic amidohydrolase
MYDLIIRNGLIINSDGIVNADLAIQDEQIAAIGLGLSGRRVIDAAGCYVIPAPSTRTCICKCRWRDW